MQPNDEQHPVRPAKMVRAPIALAPLLLLSAVAFTAPPEAPAGGPPTAPERRLGQMEARAAVMARGLALADSFYLREVAPVERILRPYHEDGAWVRRVAIALVREGRRADVDPRVLASVVLVENPWLDADIKSPQGAVGLMQVMPFHAGNWEGCTSADLEDPDANVCHGARIFKEYLERAGGDFDRALLAYNGCVRGTNTPDCHLYPSHVYSRAGRAALKVWMGMN